MKRRRGVLVTFERASVTTDDYGAEVETWGTLCQEHAEIFYGRGDERRQAAVEQGQQAASFEVPSNTNTRSVTLKDRITFDSNTWDIESRELDRPTRRRITFEATRAL